ncbi:helix-turn-helix domain-containing protein [Coralliovum pocilloporae]|uniref:helix-turn-helix domain-containing protein n=1 Tax=Coralliovum pocilloporae TaxID=3066369 RepID=UPI003307A00E
MSTGLSGSRSNGTVESKWVTAACLQTMFVVAAAFRLSLDDLRGTSRGSAEVAFGRQVAMYLSHVSLGLSLTDVGREFTRDRTTVAHACRTVEDQRDDPRTEAVLSCLEATLKFWFITIGKDMQS